MCWIWPYSLAIRVDHLSILLPQKQLHLGNCSPMNLQAIDPKGNIRMMSHVLDMAVFPGNQGGPLEHIIASKAIAFGELLTDEFTSYAKQVQTNAQAMADAFVSRGYHISSGGTDNHLMLIDLRNKNLTGKNAQETLD